MRITSNPLENYGFTTWEADDDNVAYYRLEIQELDWEGGDTIINTLERIEIWDKCFVKIADDYLTEPAPYRQFRFLLQGYDSNHNSMPTVMAADDGPPATKGCYWECESSDFAYRIQQYDNPNGGWNYRFEQAYETFDEELSMAIPYFRWFSTADFNIHIGHSGGLVPPGLAQWHNYGDWESFIDNVGGPFSLASKSLPHLIVAEQDFALSPTYWDHLGHEITSSTVKGIRKGFGQWFNQWQTSIFQLTGYGTDYCESTPDLIFMRQFMSQELNINPALTCPPNLGSGPSYGGSGSGSIKFPGGFDLIKFWRWEFVKEPLGGYGGGGSGSGHQGTPLDQEIVFFNGDNWMERISDLFAEDINGSVEERFAHILSESELFALERFDTVRTVMVNGNFETFFSADGTPTFPDLNLTESLYRLSVKLKDRKVFFLVFEVRHPFDMTVELESYFEAILFPNPHTDDNIKANITTTAALKVNYTLFDGMGNVLHTRNFNLAKDHAGEHSLNFDGHLPDGFLYHKFTFEDGSHKTYITVKQ